MKKILEIVLIICLAVGLMASNVNKKEKIFLCQNQYRSLKSDTSGNSQHIRIDLFNLSILPPSSGVQYYRDGIVFLSSSKTKGKMLPDQISFGTIDAYYAIIEDSVLGNQTVFSPSTLFPFPCEAITFSRDFNTMYYTKYSIDEGVEKIYETKYSQENDKQGTWSFSQQPLGFCTSKSTYSHPTLSIDGKTMIFASNCTGSIGGMDLFMTRNNNGTWSTPVNLGNTINTTLNELFPFLDSNNNIFFSSDGHPGMGGYDIFVSKFNGETWNKPINLKEGINSQNNEIAFTINRKDGKSAFFSSKPKSDKKSLQLYRVTLKNNEYPLTTLSNIFTGTSTSEKKPSEVITASESKPALVSPIKTREPETKTQPKVLTETGKKTNKEAESPKPPVKKANNPYEKVINDKVIQTKPAVAKTEKIEGTTPTASAAKETVVYRVQISSGSSSKSKNQITVNGKSHNTFEYFYNGAYRTCIGEFSSLSPAKEFQNTIRKSGYPQAFVVAFKNNLRSTDPALFK